MFIIFHLVGLYSLFFFSFSDVEPVKAEEESKQDAEAANDDTEMKEAE